jgi:PAS domain S-box-containing protein
MTLDMANQGIILIVDDTPANLGVLFNFLADSGFQVAIAEDGESAIQIAEYAAPDLILLDILMPEMDGFETCYRLKANQRTAEIPVIFMTALTETVDKVKGLNLGAVDYITKPLQSEELLARVKLHLSLRNLTKQLQEKNIQLEQEIQQRQQHQAASEVARNWSINILESITDAFFTLDQQWRFTYLNPQAESLLQRQRHELLGKIIWDEFPEAVHSAFYEKYHRAIAEQISVAFEEFYPPLDMWCAVHAYPIPDGLSVYFQNITKRKLQQQRSHLFADVTLKIRQSLDLREILQTAVTEVQKILQADRVLIYRLYPDGTGKGVAEEVLPGLPTVLGYKFSEEVFPEEYRELYRQGRIRTIADVQNQQEDVSPCLVEFVQQFEVRAKLIVPIHMKEELWGLLIAHQCRGPRQWTDFEIALLRQLADQIGIAIMQAQLLEQETRQRQELARSNTELQQFAYIASHDLQEPLRMVTSYLQLLERRYKNKLDADANDFIAYAVDGANRMKTLINDLLAYSRISTCGNSFALIDAAVAVEKAIANLKLAIEDHNATITYNELPHVVADVSQLTQLFQNLIGNGIKFHSDISPIVHIQAERQAGEWLFSVQDNGIGIELQYAKRIFVIFQRLHTRTEYPDTGIGLAICKKIVDRHGGQIWVESELGRGATFYFTIPDHDHWSNPF